MRLVDCAGCNEPTYLLKTQKECDDRNVIQYLQYCTSTEQYMAHVLLSLSQPIPTNRFYVAVDCEVDPFTDESLLRPPGSLAL